MSESSSYSSESSGHSSAIHRFPGGEFVVSPVLLRAPFEMQIDPNQPEPTVRQRMEDEYSGLPQVKIVFNTTDQAKRLNKSFPTVLDISHNNSSIWAGIDSKGLVVSIASDTQIDRLTPHTAESWGQVISDLEPILNTGIVHVLKHERESRTGIRRNLATLSAFAITALGVGIVNITNNSSPHPSEKVVDPSLRALISSSVFGLITYLARNQYLNRTSEKFDLEYSQKGIKARQFSKLITETAKKFIKVKDTTSNVVNSL